jgi:signal transduction histidine kinase
MEAVLVDDKSVPDSSQLNGPVEPAETSVRPGAQRVEFRYRVVDLTSSRKTRLRYRLDGFDQEWMDAGEQRGAIYHHLPPGRYRFQLVAANKYGSWTAKGASAAIVVAPHYWQTYWFKAGMGVTLLGALWFSRAVTLRRMDRQRRRREEFALGLIQSQEAERKRIAQELHDSLGQDLILIRNAAKLSLRKFAPAPPISDQLNDMAELASHALTNARAITSNLRPPELDRLGLTAALEAITEKHASHSDIQLTATIQNVNGVWSADQEIHVYRVVQESLNNALKHAHPQRIRLVVEVLDREVSILVEDDGCGFDPEAPAANGGGIGLPGLRERVRILGGVMELNSGRGQGTIFRCRIPVSVYGKK